MNAWIAARLLASQDTTEAKTVASPVDPSVTPSPIRGHEVPEPIQIDSGEADG